MSRSDAPTRNPYKPGHPWHYVLGGRPLNPRQIWQSALRDDYQGYRADEISAFDRRAEPQRSEALRDLRASVVAQLRADLSRYRRVVFALHRLNRSSEVEPRKCYDEHVAVSLKHNHLYNDFALLTALDERLTRQRDLFE